MGMPQGVRNDQTARQFAVGSVFSRAWSALMTNVPLFFGLTFLTMLPFTIFSFNLPEKPATSLEIFAVLAGQVVYLTCILTAQGFAAFAAYKALQGGKASVRETLSHALPRLAPLLFTAFLVGSGCFAGALLLVVPGLILLCSWGVAAQVCVAEKQGVAACLKRSMELTKGYRWKILGCFLVIVLIGAVAGMMLGGMMKAANNMFAAFLFSTLLAALPQSFGVVVYAVIYYDLRSIKEGVSMDRLTDVFDSPS